MDSGVSNVILVGLSRSTRLKAYLIFPAVILLWRNQNNHLLSPVAPSATTTRPTYLLNYTVLDRWVPTSLLPQVHQQVGQGTFESK